MKMLGTTESGNAINLDWALAVAAMLAALQIAAPHFRGFLKRHSVTVGSLGAARLCDLYGAAGRFLSLQDL